MKISIVTTLYNSSKYIRQFYNESIEALKALSVDQYEIIFVDDGSQDDSLDIAIELTELDPNIITIELSQNFGHHKAIMTGLRKATGDYVFFVDSDLQERPNLLVDFYQTLIKENVEVVYGIQESRRGSLFEKISGSLFYKLFNMLSEVKIPKNMLNVRIMTKIYVENLTLHDEKAIFLAGIWTITGFNQRPKVVVRTPKQSTSYTLRKKLSLMVSGVASFSNKPLIMVFYIGLFICAAAFLSMIYILYLYYQGVSVPGYLSTIASTWLIGGILLLCQGIMAIYLAKIFEEVKNRPSTIIKKTHGKEQ